MPDLVVRGGTVVDGTGAPARTADVAIDGGRRRRGRRGRRRRRDARDRRRRRARHARASSTSTRTTTARPRGTRCSRPSCWHGVTTVVMGNCGVGFAPVRARPARVARRADGRRRGHPRRRAVGGHQVGVGDLPRVPRRARSHAAGARRRHAGAARRGPRLRHGRARREQRAGHPRGHRGDGAPSWARASRPARSASRPRRTIVHTAIDGEPVPGTFAAEDELFGLGEASAKVGRGVFELAPAGALGEDLAAAEREMDWMRRKLGAHIGRPISFAAQPERRPIPTSGAGCSTWPRPRSPKAPTSARRCTPAPCRCCIGLGTFHPLMCVPRGPRSRRCPATSWSPCCHGPRCGSGSSPSAACWATTRTCGFQRRPHVPARRPARLRARSRPRRSPPGPPRDGRDAADLAATTCSSPTAATSCSTAPILNYADG